MSCLEKLGGVADDAGHHFLLMSVSCPEWLPPPSDGACVFQVSTSTLAWFGLFPWLDGILWPFGLMVQCGDCWGPRLRAKAYGPVLNHMDRMAMLGLLNSGLAIR